MKNFLYGVLLGLVVTIIGAAIYCGVAYSHPDAPYSEGAKSAPKELAISDTLLKGTDPTVVAINLDKEYMATFGKYHYFESIGQLKTYLDKSEGYEMANLVSIYQTDVDNPSVFKFGHDFVGKKDWAEQIPDGFWCEDVDLNLCENKFIGFEKAYELVMKSNYAKPHSAYVVLRQQLGPHMTNPQYIFGNLYSGLLFVDAVTGEVTDNNPAFPKQ